jgi:hypothetical protein
MSSRASVALALSASTLALILLFWGVVLTLVVTGRASSLRETSGISGVELGTILTFALAVAGWIYSWFATRKAEFVRVVTSERVKWIESVRQNVSKFAGLVHTWKLERGKTPARDAEILGQIDQLTYLIRLQLNPRSELDARIESKLMHVAQLASLPHLDPLLTVLDEITRLTQQLLKTEWDKVKAESEQGRLT